MTLELAERCEQATGPDRLLDANIHWRVKRGDFAADADYRKTSYCYSRGGWTLNKADRIHLNTVGVPFYTASLDAAMTLVPEGYARESQQAPGKYAHYQLITLTLDKSIAHKGYGATMPLAICAAALRAHAGQQP